MAKSKKLFGTKDRDASHQRLIEEQKKHPLAECREDLTDPNEPYQVWDGPITVEER